MMSKGGIEYGTRIETRVYLGSKPSCLFEGELIGTRVPSKGEFLHAQNSLNIHHACVMIVVVIHCKSKVFLVPYVCHHQKGGNC